MKAIPEGIEDSVICEVSMRLTARAEGSSARDTQENPSQADKYQCPEYKEQIDKEIHNASAELFE